MDDDLGEPYLRKPPSGVKSLGILGKQRLSCTLSPSGLGHSDKFLAGKWYKHKLTIQFFSNHSEHSGFVFFHSKYMLVTVYPTPSTPPCKTWDVLWHRGHVATLADLTEATAPKSFRFRNFGQKISSRFTGFIANKNTEFHCRNRWRLETLEVTSLQNLPLSLLRRLGTRNHIAGHPGRCMKVIAVACLKDRKAVRGEKHGKDRGGLICNKNMVLTPRLGVWTVKMWIQLSKDMSCWQEWGSQKKQLSVSLSVNIVKQTSQTAPSTCIGVQNDSNGQCTNHWFSLFQLGTELLELEDFRVQFQLCSICCLSVVFVCLGGFPVRILLIPHLWGLQPSTNRHLSIVFPYCSWFKPLTMSVKSHS